VRFRSGVGLGLSCLRIVNRIALNPKPLGLPPVSITLLHLFVANPKP